MGMAQTITVDWVMTHGPWAEAYGKWATGGPEVSRKCQNPYQLPGVLTLARYRGCTVYRKPCPTLPDRLLQG